MSSRPPTKKEIRQTVLRLIEVEREWLAMATSSFALSADAKAVAGAIFTLTTAGNDHPVLLIVTDEQLLRAAGMPWERVEAALTELKGGRWLWIVRGHNRSVITTTDPHGPPPPPTLKTIMPPMDVGAAPL